MTVFISNKIMALAMILLGVSKFPILYAKRIYAFGIGKVKKTIKKHYDINHRSFPLLGTGCLRVREVDWHSMNSAVTTADVALPDSFPVAPTF